ncbi:MAG: hypothetical protein KDJ19_00595 [Hyphomicrobiaceae bacterium]|nr:hypothetical protein [Hyphomicrobiaceae bacterium]MCC0024605.1 hypothetical protein [Hyphomicrobiaceae bacterium]
MTDRAGRQFGQEQYRALKTAFRMLVAEMGKQTYAAEVTRVEQAAISKYGAPHDFEHFPPVDVVADLERHSGDPVVTSLMAQLQGGVFVKLPTGGMGEVELSLAQCSKEFSDVVQQWAFAIADGTFTRAEADDLLPEVDELIEAAVRLKHVLAAKAGEGRG